MTQPRNERRIVVGVDGSAYSKQALRWAVEQARLTGATVQAILAWRYPTDYGLGLTAAELQDVTRANEQLLTEAVTEVAGRQPPAPIRTVVVEGHPAQVLLQASDDAELLVVGSRGHGGFVGALLGSISQYCVQHARCPVVVVPAHAAPAPPQVSSTAAG